ncbi:MULTISPECIES: cell division protein ZapC domain-containing protein [unclassified Pseudoalteromonas]|uniref:cell division protein ZapC domain-containing protein n=1 Tax=unclassified Pseudoalteromonas TaxID=194690 RepID=UPI000CF70AC4|nr:MULTISPECIES: cell division protein ZapC domain-containing protein [unclassified Pseudoalteromonas]
MLQAQQDWQWQVCEERNTLLLDMGDMQFCTPYKSRQLIDEAFTQPKFNLRDAEFYQQVCQYLSGFSLWNDAHICQIALNATAVKHYLKPMLAKSWFFAPYTGNQANHEAVVQLTSSQQSGQFLIVDCAEQASVCLCLESSFALDENLQLQQFAVIKVLNDRITPIFSAQGQQKSA